MTQTQVQTAVGAPDAVEVLNKSTFTYPALSKAIFRHGNEAIKWSYHTAPGETRDFFFDTKGNLVVQGGTAQASP